MRDNPVKATLGGGGVALGTMCFEFASNGIGAATRAAGADFMIYDMEHTGWGIETIGRLIAGSGRELVPMVRVPRPEGHFISRALDVGALGIMVPMVGSGDVARAVVDAAKYPPEGGRGTAFGIAHDDFLTDDPPATMRAANDRTLILTQIETRAGLEAVDEIAAVPGVDVLWVGQYDLTTSLGIPGQFDDPQYHEAIERVAGAAERHGKTAGFMAATVEEAHRMLDLGYRALAYWGDVWLYQRALREGLQQIRTHS